uniref:SEC31 homolog A, COPII coat complex component n=1 Tax=Periophthalmus magnuspinnatus TaxID=409849 RepID=A0A3B4AXZ4_9GOBI
LLQLNFTPIAWSSADPELLLSCGKDGRILCWNPNTAEILYELPTGNQWCFDIQWCPRNPAVLSSAGFNSCINIYSIMGGTNQAQSQRHVDQISNSFGNMDPFGTGQTLPPLELPQSGTLSTTVNPLKKPPKWIQRPVGASFAFGGKLVSLDNGKPNPQQPNSHVVHVSQVVTETDLLKRSNQLQDTISSGQFLEFCQGKINLAENEFEKTVWSFLKANFDSDSRSRFLELLGYNKEELALKVDYEESSQDPFSNIQVPNVDRLITQALLTGDFEGAVELCLHDNRMADSIILAIAGGAELLKKTQKKYFIKSQSKLTKLISAVVMKDLHDIMSTCELQNWKEALAAVMTYAQTQEFSALCDLLGGRLEGANDPMLQAQACLCYICAGNLEKLVSCWIKAQEGSNPHSLQDLVEKVVVMQHAVEQTQNLGPLAVGVLLAKKMSEYAKLLASQGCLTTALSYLPNESNHVFYLFWITPDYAQVNQYPQGAGGLTEYRTHQDSPPMAPLLAEPVPSQAAYAPSPLSSQCPSFSSSSNPPLFPKISTSTPCAVPPSSMGSFQHGGPGSPGSYMLLPPQRPQNGWNDPPTLSRVPKKKLVPQNYTPPAPITAPIMAPLGVNLQSQQMPSGSPQTMGQIPHAVQTPYSGMQQPLPSSAMNSMNTTMPKTSSEGPPGAPIGDAIQPPQSMPAEKITKKPIPDEHFVLKTTFEGLIQKCLIVATDPQTKRKLDDANKRLETLYDKLREQTLSPAIVGGLHNIARTIESRSYAEGLNIHTHIVSSSNFSEISGFMPVLKVVLTQAKKLGV